MQANNMNKRPAFAYNAQHDEVIKYIYDAWHKVKVKYIRIYFCIKKNILNVGLLYFR